MAATKKEEEGRERSAAWIGRMGWVGLARSAGEKYRVAPRRGREGSGGSGRLRLDGRRSKKYIFGAKGTRGEGEEEALSRFSVEELAAAGQVSLSLPPFLPRHLSQSIAFLPKYFTYLGQSCCAAKVLVCSQGTEFGEYSSKRALTDNAALDER